ncbi:MAG: dephospho-CoA kinase, partial [Lachnospiraceae bacterium]|nr:dephospho-CoA kinase [Lachnospiraceae bacterium]
MTDNERNELISSMKKSIVIGVTGGVGAGKSSILKYLQEKWQAETLVLDEVSREMLAIGGLCY